MDEREQLRKAAEWLLTNYKATLAGKPVRDADESIQFAESALSHPQGSPGTGVQERLDELCRALSVIGVVGQLDGHDVVRRSSVMEVAWNRAALATAQPAPQEAQPVVGYVTRAISWSPRQSEQVVKVTRLPQPLHGFNTPLFSTPQPARAGAVDYTVVHKFAEAHRLSYNECAAMVCAAMAAAGAGKGE